MGAVKAPAGNPPPLRGVAPLIGGPPRDETPVGVSSAPAGNSPIMERVPEPEEEVEFYDMGSDHGKSRGHGGGDQELTPREKARKGIQARKKLKEPLRKKVFGMSKALLSVLCTCLVSASGLAEEVFAEPIYDLRNVINPMRGSSSPACLEIFAGRCTITGAFADKQYGVLRPRDLKFGDDLRCKETQEEILEAIDTHRPRLVWMSPPCTFWCGFSNLNYNPQQLRRLRARERVFLRFIDQVILKQKMYGGHAIVENPRKSAMWREQILAKWLSGGSCSYVDLEMCAFGLLDTKGENHLRKPMRLLVTDKAFAEELQRYCPGDHTHVRVQGSQTAHSAGYPEDFGKAVVRAFEKVTTQTAYVQDDGGEEVTAKESPGGGKDISFTGNVSGRVAGALRRLHQNLGHPPNRELAKHLRLSGASQDLIEAASGLKCRACEKCARPPLHPVAKPAALLDFNEAVAIDIIFLDNQQSKGNLALNMVDIGSSYQVVAPLRNRKSDTVLRVFLKYWVNWAGPPGRLVLDLDTAFADSFADLTSDLAISMRAAAGQAHWQKGIAERYGSSWKSCWEKLCVAEGIRDEDMLDAICAVNDARNSLRNRSGFSPRQWVFGTNGRLVADLEDGGHEMSALHAVTPEGRMARKHALRNGARIAFFEVQASAAVERALAHKNRTKPKEYKPGDLVYYFRQTKKKGKQASAMWMGPAAIIGQEGQNYWLARGGRCILAAPEHLRAAEHEEVSEILRIKAAIKEVEGVLEEEQKDYADLRSPHPEGAGDVEVEMEIEGIFDDEDEEMPIAEASASSSRNEKRKKVFENEQELKKMARQLGALDDVPASVRSSLKGLSSATTTEAPGNVSFLVKKANSPEGWEKALEKEIPWGMIPESERHLYIAAEEKQWKEHLEFGAVKPLTLEESERVKAEVDPARILPARFLYRDKHHAKRKIDPNIACKAKARLCVGGQRDPDLGVKEMEVDAPTASRHSLLLGLQVALVRGWLVSIGDIRAAFLNGVEAPRSLFFKQPVRGIPGLQPGQLIEILKGVFGLSTSPKLWWIRLFSELTQITFQVHGKDYQIIQNNIDPCVFQVLRVDGEGHQVCGLIFTHVDDLMVMADPAIHGCLETSIQARFPVDEWERDRFDYVGCEYHVTKEEINITQTGYVQSRLNKVKIPTHQAETDVVDSATKELNRSVVGCLSWLAKQTRPDLQFMVAQAQKSQANPTIADVKWTNSIVELARKFQDKGIKLKRIDDSQLCVFGFHDAAWANVSLDQESPDDIVWDTDCKKASQLASLVMIADQKCLANQPGNIGIVDWRSKSSSRICRSTFAGETMACSDAMESAIYLRGLLLSFLHVGLVDSTKAREMIPLHLFTDCRSLYDHLHKDGVPKPPTEKRLALDLAAMRMELNEEGKAQWKLRYGERAELRPDRPRRPPLHWVPTDRQLADVLTKRMNPSKWWDQVASGILQISLRVWDDTQNI